MYGRIKATVLAATALAVLAGWSALETRADDKDAHAEHFAACAKACTKCMRECESCAHHCVHLVAEGKKDHLKSVGTCSDCAEFCAMAAKVVSHHGPMAGLSCEACAKACDACAAECDRCCEKSPDEHMKRCADVCRECAKACREMVKHAGHAAAATDGGK